MLYKLGERIRKLRKVHNISQEELAHRAGMHRTYIGMIERAEKNITLQSIEKIAYGLGVNVCLLLHGLYENKTKIRKSCIEPFNTDNEKKHSLENDMDMKKNFYATSLCKSIVNNSFDLIYILNNKGIIIFENRATERILGYKAGSRLGEPCFNYIHKNDKDRIINEFNHLVKTQNYTEITELRFMHEKGHYLWFEACAQNLLDCPEVGGILINSRNISSRKNTENELNITNEKLKLANSYASALVKKAQEANNAKAEFLANISHKIRTPLGGITGFAKLLLKTKLTKTQKEYIEKVNISADMLLDIVNDILDFSKIEAGKLELDEVLTDIRQLATSIISVFKSNADIKGIKLILNIDNNVPEYIFTDPTRLKQVLANLISNAIKFTKAGKVELNIKYDDTTKINGHSCISFIVKDTGIGISKEQQGKIFEAFSQANSSTTRKYGGTGLGLAICNKIIKKMGSEIFVDSIPGKGSAFSFKIARNLRANNDFISKEDKQADNNSLEKANISILIVEDAEVIQFLMKEQLKYIIPNANVLCACNSIEGIEVYKKNKPQVVLLDIQLPDKNGYTVAHEIRDYEKDNGISPSVIIAATARVISGEKEKCIKADFDDFLAKPITQDVLNKVLNNHLSGKMNKFHTAQNNRLEIKQTKARHFNKKSFLNRINDDESLYDDIMPKSIEQVSLYITELKQAINEKDFVASRQQAHKIKGVAKFLCFDNMAKLLEDMEACENKKHEEFSNLLYQVEDEFKIIKKLVTEEKSIDS